MTKYTSKYYSPYSSAKLLIRRFLRDTLKLSPKVKYLFNYVRQLPQDSSVLDVGCGTGGLLELIERENFDLNTIGIDLGVPESFIAKGTFIRGSGQRLPFVDNSFDLVTCSHVLEHLQDPFYCIQEILRVCKPNGMIYIETPSPRAAYLPFVNIFWDDPTHVRPYSVKSLCRMLEMNVIQTMKWGTKKSLPAVLFGFPYWILGSILKDEQAKAMFTIYMFGFSVYVIGKKK